jgi:hypothetical protein
VTFILQSYGYLEDEDEKEQAAKAEPEPDAVFVDPRSMSKKARKKAEAGVGALALPLARRYDFQDLHMLADILMQPNRNAAIVKGAELQRRKDDAAKAAAKREKDKTDLKKQKCICAPVRSMIIC